MIGRVFAGALRCLAVAAALAIAGCVGNVSQPSAAIQSLNYEQTLHKCRKAQPGRLNHRLLAPPTHPGVARCLRRHGWQPDGSAHSSQ